MVTILLFHLVDCYIQLATPSPRPTSCVSPRLDSGIHSVFDFNNITDSDLSQYDLLHEQVGSDHHVHHHHHDLNGDLKHVEDVEEGHEMKVFNIGGAPGGESHDDVTPPHSGSRLPPLDHPRTVEQLPPIRTGNLENGWTNSAYATENNNKGRHGDSQSTALSQSAAHPSNYHSNQNSDPQNVLQKKPMTPSDVDSPIKEETPSTASEENKEQEEVG